MISPRPKKVHNGQHFPKRCVSTKKDNKEEAGKLTEEQKQQIKEAFDLFNTEGTGSINSKELEVAKRALGSEPKKEEIHIKLSDTDDNRTSAIEYKEFLKTTTCKNLAPIARHNTLPSIDDRDGWSGS